MGNAESTASDLHDNYLAVLKSVENRLGQFPNRSLSFHSQPESNGRSRVRTNTEEACQELGKRDAANRPRKLSSKGEKPSRSVQQSGLNSSVDHSSASADAKKRGKERAHRRRDAAQSDEDGNSSHPSDGKRRTAKGEPPNLESTATGSDWEDAAVNDFAEEDDCAVASPAHFKLQTKDSGVKAPSPRLFPCETLSDGPSQRDLEDDEKTEVDGSLGSSPGSPTASAGSVTGATGGRSSDARKERAEGKGKDPVNTSDKSKRDPRQRSNGSVASSGTSGACLHTGQPHAARKSSPPSKQSRQKEQVTQLSAADIALPSHASGGCTQEGKEKGWADGDLAEFAGDFEGFSPHSPSYSFGLTKLPKKAIAKSGKTEERPPSAGTSARGSGNKASADADACIYGNKKNHFPFLDEPALSLLVPFLFGKSLATCMAVCPHWFMKVNRAMEHKCAPVTKGFQQMYSKYLKVWGSAVKLQPLQTAGDGGVRVDWVIFAKVLPACEGNILDISYTYSYIPDDASSTSRSVDDKASASGKTRARGRQTGERTRSSSQFDEGVILSPCGQPCPTHTPSRSFTVSYSLAASAAHSSRTLWMHRDMCRFHGDETGVAAMGSVARVCVGDFVEVAVTVYSGGGRVALDNVHWLPARTEHRQESVSTRGVFNREICPLERCSPEWLPADQFRILATERPKAPEDFSPHLKHVKTEFSGMDVAVRKSRYRAVRQGSLGSAACRCWGFPCEILPQGLPVVCSLTRRGLQHDRFLSVQLREGDVLDYYVSQGGATA
ncbi:conserved hypothetical protein [Neospora caninum Liverpool]|uniref:Uncharacterized protein n=1 Tax=Neospora caninum (strain Liverpool) TaxID=572307 RepID=F0VMX3_NEOCL|nr:conserved hypothetical protein [Neospora caninum Liverpool]CBZ55069.1 conserved hypothetical protein [Neospora caninum Liverpool]CEL69793.1 TPA: hypothetical protein BN1204_054940 [Neospora caninum Liverpool]|eukprot:XP_003885097.1 conserved hypothetical protein [Neospora caninum Liverpool]